MPGKLAQRRDKVADAAGPNDGDRQDVLDVVRGEPDPGATMSQIDTHRIKSFPQRTHNRPHGPSAEAAGPGPGRARTGSHVLHMHESAASHGALESSTWDWDTPLDTIGESSSYYYEPQGELAQEPRPQHQTNSDFSIPHSVTTSGSGWKPANRADPLDTSTTSNASTRPPGVPTPTAGVKRKSTSETDASGRNRPPEHKRPSRTMSEDGDDETPSPMDQVPLAQFVRPQSTSSLRGRSATEVAGNRRPPSTADAEGLSTRPNIVAGSQRPANEPATSMVLPARKVFPIQIGDKLFRLSGASISSDAPSYFSQFFEEQLRQSESSDNVRTLYIDRDPATFEDISLHLQGYHIEPRDGPHFVKLFADAQFFSLPRLTAQLFASPIYIRIGDVEFQIPRDLFSNPGDSPNYFSLGFAIFFTTPTEVFPGLNQRTLLRPPSILPPSVPNRSARTFADLLHILKGCPVEIKSDEHRSELLRDARYFHLKGLEQRLMPHAISYNLARKSSEILLRLEDIRQSGISFVSDSAATSPAASPGTATSSSTPTRPGWVHYQRPYVDSEAHSLIVETGGTECAMLSIAPGSSAAAARFGRATFHRQTLSRVTSLLSVIAHKMNLPITQPLGLLMMERGQGVAGLPVSPGNSGLSEERVKVRIGADAEVVVDGKRWAVGEDEEDGSEAGSMSVDLAEGARVGGKRRRVGGGEEEEEGEEWVLRKAQWRLRVQPLPGGAQAGRSGMEVILGAVKLEAYSSERGRNAARGFLG
ncbi:hypothetical protein LTR53_016978 [Teratosphaeriaceae sp. CCFEE 6253]|nr:hypothetical protein LTR53_016978 [Teratosphaeriaceae sp. CCFEE 6253]